MKSVGCYIYLKGIPCIPLNQSFSPKADSRAPSSLTLVTAAALPSCRPGPCHTFSTLARGIFPEYPPAAPEGLRVKFRLPGVAHKSCVLWPCSPHQCSVLTSIAQCQGCVMPSSTFRPLSTLFSLVQLFPFSDFYPSSPFFSLSIIASRKSFLSWVRCLPLQPSPVLPPILAPRTQRNCLATCSSLARNSFGA